MSDVISSVSPIVQSGYDVYLDGERLLYVKSSCSEVDRTTGFFLHVVPVDPNDLKEGREDHGFDNLDFTFISHQGWRSGSSCFVVVELPGYEIRGDQDWTGRAQDDRLHAPVGRGVPIRAVDDGLGYPLAMVRWVVGMAVGGAHDLGVAHAYTPNGAAVGVHICLTIRLNAI